MGKIGFCARPHAVYLIAKSMQILLPPATTVTQSTEIGHGE